VWAGYRSKTARRIAKNDTVHATWFRWEKMARFIEFRMILIVPVGAVRCCQESSLKCQDL
jgi:hypothetical protein